MPASVLDYEYPRSVPFKRIDPHKTPPCYSSVILSIGTPWGPRDNPVVWLSNGVKDFVGNFKTQYLDQNLHMYGELGCSEQNVHPLPCRIDLDRLSHRVVDFRITEAKDCHGDPWVGYEVLTVIIETLPTEKGIELNKLLSNGVQLYPKLRLTGLNNPRREVEITRRGKILETVNLPVYTNFAAVAVDIDLLINVPSIISD